VSAGSVGGETVLVCPGPATGKGDLHRRDAEEKMMGSTGSVFRKSLSIFLVTSILCVTASAQYAYRGTLGNRTHALPLTPLLFNTAPTLAYEAGAYADKLRADANRSFRYGKDADGVAFALAPDGVKGRFAQLTPQVADIQIDRGGRVGPFESVDGGRHFRQGRVRVREVAVVGQGGDNLARPARGRHPGVEFGEGGLRPAAETRRHGLMRYRFKPCLRDCGG
jgi:hypothetical protein